MLNIDLTLKGNSSREEKIPARYKFVTLFNNTSFKIKLYNKNLNQLVADFPVRAVTTIPLLCGNPEHDLEIQWTGSGDTQARMIFTENSLGINQTFSTEVGTTSTIVGDEVGLALGNQLPDNLTGAGNLKVALVEETLDIAKETQLPTALTGSGNLKVAVTEITTEDYSSTNATASGDTTIKASGGYVSKIFNNSAVTIILKDGGTTKWKVPANGTQDFPKPLKMNTNIVLNLSGTGDVFILWK